MKMENEKSQIEILKHMQADLSIVKKKIISLEMEVEEISGDIHGEFNPEFLKKIEKLGKQRGSGIKFNSMKEFHEHYSK